MRCQQALANDFRLQPGLKSQKKIYRRIPLVRPRHNLQCAVSGLRAPGRGNHRRPTCSARCILYTVPSDTSCRSMGHTSDPAAACVHGCRACGPPQRWARVQCQVAALDGADLLCHARRASVSIKPAHAVTVSARESGPVQLGMGFQVPQVAAPTCQSTLSKCFERHRALTRGCHQQHLWEFVKKTFGKEL